MKNRPLVSVVMPVYNAEKYLKTSVESILNQTYTNYEFVIVDDASTDASQVILQEYSKKNSQIKLLRNKDNLGVTGSLNKALDYVKGKYVVRMDADDWSNLKRLELQVDLMEENPNVVVSGSYIEVCDSNLQTMYIRRYQLDDKNIRKRMFRYSPFAHPATIWRTSDLKKERYSEKARNCEDYELYFRIGRLGRFMNTNKVLLRLRLHPSSISASMNDNQSKMTVAIRRNAAKKLGYHMSLLDKIYTRMQDIGIRLIPVRLRFFLFNQLRKLDFY